MKKMIVFLLVMVLMMTPFILFGGEKESKKFTIGVVAPELSNEFWRNFVDLVYKMAEQVDVEVVHSDAESREENTVKLVENMLTRGVDGLIVGPVTASVGPKSMELAEAAGVPVVFAARWAGVDPDTYKGKYLVGYVGSSYYETSYYMMGRLYEAGSRKFVSIQGQIGNAPADDMARAVADFVNERSDTVLLQEVRNTEVREDGLRATENFLSAFPGPGFDGVVAFNDETALGAVKALKNIGALDKVHVVGKDMITDAIDAWKKGDLLYTGGGGGWAISAFAFFMLYDHLNGYEPLQKVVWMANLNDITLDELPLYEDQFMKGLPNYDTKNLTQTHNPNLKITDWSVTLVR